MDLAEWAELYLKHQDLLKREIKRIDRDGNILLVEKKNGDEEWLLEEPLELHDPRATGIICKNTAENLKTLVSRWKEVKGHKVKIIFANPTTNERWVVVPSHHDKIADPKSLKAGLEAMASGVTKC